MSKMPVFYIPRVVPIPSESTPSKTPCQSIECNLIFSKKKECKTHEKNEIPNNWFINQSFEYQASIKLSMYWFNYPKLSYQSVDANNHRPIELFRRIINAPIHRWTIECRYWKKCSIVWASGHKYFKDCITNSPWNRSTDS